MHALSQGPIGNLDYKFIVDTSVCKGCVDIPKEQQHLANTLFDASQEGPIILYGIGLCMKGKFNAHLPRNRCNYRVLHLHSFQDQQNLPFGDIVSHCASYLQCTSLCSCCKCS